MSSQLRKCPKCGRYTLLSDCSKCAVKTISPVPPRYSPEDPYGNYRRISIRQEYGENGKYRKV